MRFIPRWLGGGIERKPGLQDGSPLFTFGVKKKAVTQESAMQISAVWAAVQLKATVLASLSIHFYRMVSDGREANDDHPLARLLSFNPNRYQTRMEFFETLGLNLYLTGNAYCLIDRLPNGEIVSLMPLMSSQVTVELMNDGSIVYTHNDGQNVRAYAAESIWHVKLFGNGVTGLSPLQHAAPAISMAISGEEWASNIIGNGGKPTGVLMYDKLLTKEQRAQLADKFKDLREGDRDALMVLEAGMTYSQISLSPQDVQLLEARRFQIEDIARFFNVPSVLINDSSQTTVWGSGIEQIITGWYKLQFRSELERLETSMVRHLLPSSERRTVSVEFDFEELLRTDFAARVQAGSQAANAGLMTRDEWRKREWLKPKGGAADELTVQTNLISVEDLARVAGGADGN
jgi:HK97 family phage portal protein